MFFPQRAACFSRSWRGCSRFCQSYVSAVPPNSWTDSHESPGAGTARPRSLGHGQLGSSCRMGWPESHRACWGPQVALLDLEHGMHEAASWLPAFLKSRTPFGLQREVSEAAMIPDVSALEYRPPSLSIHTLHEPLPGASETPPPVSSKTHPRDEKTETQTGQ